MNVVIAAVAFVVLVLVAAAGGAAPLLRGRAVPALPQEGGRDGDRAHPPRTPGRALPAWVAWTLVLGAMLGAVVPNLSSSLHPRSGAEPITGSAPESATSSRANSPIAALEAAVRADPTNVGARLALGDRYLGARRLGEATDQYLAVLRMDPVNAPARASLGLVLYLSGRPVEGLRAVRNAIDADPSYAQARLFEGVILYRGLDRPRIAAASIRRFLRIADAGSDVRVARSLLADIRARRRA
jgi:cytochrome c-type biogenesis protein CcmH/NrfG